jgi:alkylation response protein AidB-like acyl-CoA dehydrogenase
MNFALTSEQVELKKSARRVLAATCASAQVRAAMETERGTDAAAWRTVCELGWPGLLGLGWVELAAVAEETGRALAPIPLFSSVCLAANALRAGGDEARAQAVEAGEVRGTLAFAGRVEVARGGSGYVLSGEHPCVVDGHTADVVVVATTDREHALLVVEAGVPGLEIRKEPTLDPTRPMATVTLRDVVVPVTASVGDAAALRRTLDRASIALAAESLGSAERCLDMATDYAKTRVQFDRPIGSFQAIKHKLADMLVAVETARSAAGWAATVASSDGPELATAAALAKAYCTEAFFRCAAESLQIHGGIGFTWEHDAHLFLKRARTSLSLLGAPAADRERLAARILGPVDGTPTARS